MEHKVQRLIPNHGIVWAEKTPVMQSLMLNP